MIRVPIGVRVRVKVKVKVRVKVRVGGARISTADPQCNNTQHTANIWVPNN